MCDQFVGRLIAIRRSAGRCSNARLFHIHDVLADPDHKFSKAAKLGGFRTVLGVPFPREGAVIGALLLARPAIDPFSQAQIDLVATFADQAVIAIENVRLFDEICAQRTFNMDRPPRPCPRRCQTREGNVRVDPLGGK
jgi:GAF domain-containing protein